MDRIVFFRPLHVLFPHVVREKLLHIIRGSTIACAAIELYHVRTPIVVVHIGKYRRVAIHHAHVRIIFHAQHEHGLAQSGLQVALHTEILRHGIFAHINLVGRTAVSIIFVIFPFKPRRVAVIMLIHHIYGIGIAPRRVIRAPRLHVADNGHFGIFFADGLVELDVTFRIVVALVAIVFRGKVIILISYLYQAQIEGLRMPVLCPLRAPFRGLRVAVAILNRVKRLLDVFINLAVVFGPAVPHAHVHHEERFRAQIFRQLEHLVESHPVRHAVAPVLVHVARTFLYRPDGLLPFKAVRAPASPHAFHIASAGKTHESGLHCRQHFSQVGSATVRTAFPCRREEAHHVQHHRARRISGQHKPSFRVIARGRDFSFQLCPFAVYVHRNFCGAQPCAILRLQRGGQCPLVSSFATNPKRQLVNASFHHVDAPKTFIAHAIARCVHLQPKGMSLRRVEQPFRGDRHVGFTYRPPLVRIRRVVLKRAVVNQLRIQATITRMVDFLEEKAVMTLADGRSTPASINVQRHLCRGRQHADRHGQRRAPPENRRFVHDK